MINYPYHFFQRWLDNYDLAWAHYHDFINHNFDYGGWHRLGAVWVTLHFWTDIVLIFVLLFYLKDKIKRRHK